MMFLFLAVKSFSCFRIFNMEFTKEELEIASLGSEQSDICLSSAVVKCDVCKTGTVVKVGRDAKIIIYTRLETLMAKHQEMRCNNRTLPCRAGHYHGFKRTSQTKILDHDIL